MVRKIVIGSAAGVALSTLASVASAQSTISSPGAHPDYTIEVEPHFVLAPWGPVSWGGNRAGFGPGVRLSIPATQNGFVPSINDSVAVSFGLDWLFYGTDYWGDTIYQFIIPVAMQWNFWLSPAWSVFGEPGLAVFASGNPDDAGVVPVFEIGARWLMGGDVAMDFRIGYPTFSIGISFLE